MVNNSGRAVLKVLVNGKVADSIGLGEGVLTIGRDRCDLILDDPEASSKHCKIEFVSGAHQIFDLNSTNGIFLNGQKIAKARLSAEDRIRIGKTEFIFSYGDGPGSVELGGNSFDLRRIPIPLDSAAEALDAMLTREREKFFLAMGMMVDVTYSDGTSEQLSVGKELVIGRLSVEGKFSKDDELSRRHARIFLDPDGEVWIEDLGSTNGVLVNNARIAKTQSIRESDIIKIGRCRLKALAKPGTEYGGR